MTRTSTARTAHRTGQRARWRRTGGYAALSAALLPLSAAPAAAGPSSVVLETSDATVHEGHDGTTVATFEVRRVGAFTGKAVTVSYSTVDGTAHAGSDYLARTGTLTFDKKQAVHAVAVAVLGDGTPEPDEHFLLVVSDTGGGDGEGRGRILNDDGWPPDGGA